MIPVDGEHPSLAELRAFSSLHQLLQWAFARKLDVADVVVQDEYSHDVVLPLPGGRWLVADCT